MNCKDILEKINYPTDILVLDFETFYDESYHLGKDKKAISTVEYVTHPRFEFTGLGLELLSEYNAFVGGPDVPYMIERLKKRFGKNLHNVTIVIKNAKFDALILQHHFNLIPPYIIDIDDLLRYYDAQMPHSLKDAAKLFKVKAKGDTKQFKGYRWSEMTDEMRKKLSEYCLGDIKSESELFKILLPLIDNPEFELELARHTLKLFLEPQLELDFDKAEELLINMVAEQEKAILACGYPVEQISGNNSFVALLNAALPEGETVPVKQGKNEMIPAISKDDKGRELLLNHPKKEVRELMIARTAIKSWPLHANRVRRMILQAKTANGKIRAPLNYFAGHTGRWGGTEKINLQNLGGRGRAGAGTHPLIGQVRKTIKAPDGYTLAIADSAQIEARILAWLANQENLLSDFKQGKSPYCSLASELFQVPVHKPNDGEKKTKEGRQMAVKYGFGKDGILGCGYGMGSDTFYGRCHANPDLKPLFDSGEYTWDFIDKLIKTYRKMYPRIPALWSSVEKCFRYVTKYPDTLCWIDKNGKGGSGQEENPQFPSDIRLGFFNNGTGTTFIQLPSGRKLRYRHAKVDTKTGKISYLHSNNIWGGFLIENIVQSIARDLLGYWILEFEKADLLVSLHVHDEIVSVIHNYGAEDVLAAAIEIMRQGPDWAEGLPLDAEGQLSERYTK